MAENKRTPRVRKQVSESKFAGSKKTEKAFNAKAKISSPIKRFFGKIFNFLGREYHPIKLPDNSAGNFLTKQRSLIPGFLKEAFAEIKQTSWPGAKETLRLTYAVFVFAVIFSVIVAGLDFVLDKFFRALIIG